MSLGRKIQRFTRLESAFHYLFCLKFSFKLVTFSKSYARKYKWVVSAEYSVNFVIFNLKVFAYVCTNHNGDGAEWKLTETRELSHLRRSGSIFRYCQGQGGSGNLFHDVEWEPWLSRNTGVRRVVECSNAVDDRSWQSVVLRLCIYVDHIKCRDASCGQGQTVYFNNLHV